LKIDLAENELGSASVIVSSEPIGDSPQTATWRILARSKREAEVEADKISRAVSEQGFAVFTPPHQLETGVFRYWFQLVGVTYDLLLERKPRDHQVQPNGRAAA
jgi:hypothetical protein